MHSYLEACLMRQFENCFAQMDSPWMTSAKIIQSILIGWKTRLLGGGRVRFFSVFIGKLEKILS